MVTQDSANVIKLSKTNMKKMKKKKSKKKKLKEAENIDSESETDKLDLDQPVYPLSHYVSDQEELINQMFGTIRGAKLEAMLPPVLKSIPLKELKKLSLHEVRGMSKKRIICCINGQMMEGSSGSEDEEEEKEEANNEGSKQSEANAKGEKRKTNMDQPPEDYLQKKIKVEPGLEDSTGSGEGKSVLELLELEMRARIIKTMLEKGDEGKKITEDTIAAVMQSAKEITKEDVKGGDTRGGGNKEVTGAAAESKDDPQQESNKEAVTEKDEERNRSRKRRGQGREAEHSRRHHHSTKDSKRESGRRSQRRGDGSFSDEGSRGRDSKKLKESGSPEKPMVKRKKLTRKEFEERMKRAKKNRTYRQRKSSEDEEKAEESKGEEEKAKEDNNEKTEENKQEGEEKKEETEEKKEAENMKQEAVPEDGEVAEKPDGEVSEKEEGEIDSNEEEEGACSPSDISSVSRYSSSSSYSRSRSRSYSRSRSRSPYHGKRKSSRRSRRRRRRRSYSRSHSRSCSRSRSPDWRRSRGVPQKRSYERKRSREPPSKSDCKRDIKKTQKDSSPIREEEENWGHKCDIEFVDSEEDFDDHPETSKKEVTGQKKLPVNLNQKTERASISFSLQKKPASIAQSVDLDDLPLKKKVMTSHSQTDDSGTSRSAKPSGKGEIIFTQDDGTVGSTKSSGKEEIVISSDSDDDVQKVSSATSGKQESVPESRDARQIEKQPPVTRITNLNGDEDKIGKTLKVNKENVNSKSDQGNKTTEKISKSASERENTIKSAQALNKETTESLAKPTTEPEHEKTSEKQSVETKTMLNVSAGGDSKGDTYKQQNVDMIDSTEKVTWASSVDKDSETSRDSLKNVPMGYDDMLEKSKDSEGRRESNVSVESDQAKEEVVMSSTELSKRCSDSVVRHKEKCSSVITEERLSDADVTGSQIPNKNTLYVDENNFADKEDNDSRNKVESAENSKEVQSKDNSNTYSLEVELEKQRGTVVSNPSQTQEFKHRGEKGVELEDSNVSVCSERDGENLEITESAKTNEQEGVGLVGSEIISACDDQGEEDFYRGAEQLMFSEDEKDDEEVDIEEFIKDKTPVEPIRIETGLIRKRVQRFQKIEMVVPEKSWMKKEKKKKEKTKDVLAMEGVGLLKKTLAESTQSSSQESEAETETNHSTGTTTGKELPVLSPALASDTENSQPAEDSGVHTKPSPSSKQPTALETHHMEDRVQRKAGLETEIIGVIETSKDSATDKFHDIELGGSSWSMRWLQSEKVQKVVTSSKMLSRVRKKIQRKEKATKSIAEKVEETQKPVETVIPVIGSIEEYERLFGMKVKPKAGETTILTPSQDTQGQEQCEGSSSQEHTSIPESEPKGNPVFGSDDEGEDSEEEALWSKIIKK